MTTAIGDVTYLVLADHATPYLLARVRWPDVAQAITAGSPEWLDDPGLFDLPYDSSSVRVSFPQAVTIAAAWGKRLSPEPAAGAPSFIRRMPANWSDLSPVERRALGIESVRKRRAANGTAGRSAGRRAANGTAGRLAGRRAATRSPVDGRAHIRCGRITIYAGLIDLGPDGMQCVLPDGHPPIPRGTTLDGPFLLEAAARTAQICLDVPGWIDWQRGIDGATHFDVRFDGLAKAQAEGVQRFLAAAASRGPR